MIALFAEARAHADVRRLALVALGGYGRGELAPASDVDLMLLHASRDASSVGRVAEPLFYPLWDAGFSVGNAVRTIRECAALAGQRIDAATALLDARFLAGDAALFEDLHDRTVKDTRRDPHAFVGRLRDAGLTRRDRYGSVSHLLEPELKEGSGGLRDVQAMSWTAWAVAGRGDLRALEDSGLLRASERSALEAAHDFLMRLRSALHAGPLIVGEMGDVKREIVMLGDTMNTTARIEGVCRTTEADYIASGAALALASLPANVRAQSLGPVVLRGKEGGIELFALTRNKS